MADLKQQLDALRHAVDTLPDSATASQLAQLESEARSLLAQSKNTPHEAEARELFALLARHSAPPSPEAATVRSLLRRARIRIEIAGDEDDIDAAIDILADALDHDPQNQETRELLQEAASRSPHLALKVRGLLERYGLEALPDTPPGSSALITSTPAPIVYDPPTPDSPVVRGSAEPSADLMSELSQAYYSGDYQRTVDLANRLLASDPRNVQAADYKQKSEDNLLRGVVPDHRIPFDARIAYNRANSLVRAGNYDEAERLYREARDLAARTGIVSWKDVEQALLDIQDLSLARELLTEGDRLLAADDWDGALQKYEGAQRVVHNDPMAQERIDLVRSVRQQFDQSTVQLNITSGTLTDRARQLQHLLNTLAGLRQMLPSSERMNRLVHEIEERIRMVMGQLFSQAQGALTRAESATVLEERLRLTSEAVRALETAAELAPSEGEINSLLQRARQNEADMAEARHIIERASALIAQNYENELGQARTMLTGLRSYAQDPRYRMVVSDLLSRHLERAEAALDQNDPLTAQRWLDVSKEEPFRILGRRTDILRLEEDVRQMRRRRYGIWAILAVVGLVGLAALTMATRSSWEPIINPATHTPTLTPSITATATATVTPSLTATVTTTPTWTYTPSWTPTHTWTPTPSDTPTHTWTPTITPTASDTPTLTPTFTETPTPTSTLTPSVTPTPEILCIVFAFQDGIAVRGEPSTNTNPIAYVSQGQQMEVLGQRVGTDNQLWYQVRLDFRGALLTNAWVRSDLVRDVQLAPCPLYQFGTGSN